MTVENLRSFSKAYLDLSPKAIYLIGPNNSGKTSLLVLLDMVFNRDFTTDFARASDDLQEQLLPARQTRNRARRLTIWLGVSDRRRHNKLQCEDSVAQLRLTLTVNDRQLRANLGYPKKQEKHDPKAVALLGELRDQYAFVHVPAGRSVDTDEFSNGLTAGMTAALLDVFQRSGKGATTEERRVKKLVETELGNIAAPAVTFWSDFLGRLPPGWVNSSEV